MSAAWSFCSVDPQKWDALVAGRSNIQESDIVESATWDDAYENTPLWESLARRIAAGGITYDGLISSQALELDSIIYGFFSPEGLEKQLDIEYESPEGVHISTVQSLLAKPGKGLLARIFGKPEPPTQLSLLPVLLTGRRLNGKTDMNLDERYVVFSSSELPVFHDEAKAQLDMLKPKANSGFVQAVEANLIEVIQGVQAKKQDSGWPLWLICFPASSRLSQD